MRALNVAKAFYRIVYETFPSESGLPSEDEIEAANELFNYFEEIIRKHFCEKNPSPLTLPNADINHASDSEADSFNSDTDSDGSNHGESNHGL